jgi:hypothetical protein
MIALTWPKLIFEKEEKDKKKRKQSRLFLDLLEPRVISLCVSRSEKSVLESLTRQEETQCLV